MKFSWRKIKKYNQLPVFWEKINNDIFQKIGIPIKNIPVFTYIKLPSVAALCVGLSNGTNVICLRKSKIKSHNYLKMILMHEMVHQYQFENGLPMNHDETFYSIAEKIKNKTGIDINCEEK